MITFSSCRVKASQLASITLSYCKHWLFKRHNATKNACFRLNLHRIYTGIAIAIGLLLAAASFVIFHSGDLAIALGIIALLAVIVASRTKL